MGFQGTIQRYLFEPREAPSRKKSCCYSFGSDDLHGSLAPAPRVRPSYDALSALHGCTKFQLLLLVWAPSKHRERTITLHYRHANSEPLEEPRSPRMHGTPRLRARIPRAGAHDSHTPSPHKLDDLRALSPPRGIGPRPSTPCRRCHSPAARPRNRRPRPCRSSTCAGRALLRPSTSS